MKEIHLLSNTKWFYVYICYHNTKWEGRAQVGGEKKRTLITKNTIQKCLFYSFEGVSEGVEHNEHNTIYKISIITNLKEHSIIFSRFSIVI